MVNLEQEIVCRSSNWGGTSIRYPSFENVMKNDRKMLILNPPLSLSGELQNEWFRSSSERSENMKCMEDPSPSWKLPLPPKKGAKLTFSRIPNPAFYMHFFHVLSYLDTESAENFRAQGAVVEKMYLKVQMRNTRLDVYLSGRWIKTMGPHLSMTAMQ